MREWLLLAITTICSAYKNGCLHQRSRCLRDSECRGYLNNLENICGASINNCSVESPSECVHLLWRIQDYFTNSTCVCHRASGFFEECNYFRESIWNHPCKRRMNYAGEQRRVKEQRFSLASTNAVVNGSHKRTTRTPLSDQIQQLKTQLSGDLGTREVLGKATCDSALNDVCLRHISCRQLWSLFRASCGVDQDNRCTMADRETCWQSFEGLSWTGLGNCHCDSSNSDCHWIRLHTNYNKCIHEISRSGQFSSAGASRSSQQSQRQSQAVPPTRATPPPVTTPITTTTTTTTTTAISTTTSAMITRRPPRTDSRYPVTAYNAPRTSPRPVTTSWDHGRHHHQQNYARTTTASPSWWQTTPAQVVSHSNQQRHVAPQIQAEVHYRPLFEPQVRTTPNYYYYYTTAAPRWDPRTYLTTPAQNELTIQAAQSKQYGNSSASDRREPLADERYSSSNQRWSTRQSLQPFRIKAKMDPIQPVSQQQQHFSPPTQSSPTGFTQMEYSFKKSNSDRPTDAHDPTRAVVSASPAGNMYIPGIAAG